MAVTHVPTQLWTAGPHVIGPVSKKQGDRLVSIGPGANPTTDWQSGPAGRTVDLVVRRTADGSVMAQASLTTPQMGHGGALPTLLEVDISAEPNGTQFEGLATLSADMSTGWDVGIA